MDGTYLTSTAGKVENRLIDGATAATREWLPSALRLHGVIQQEPTSSPLTSGSLS